MSRSLKRRSTKSRSEPTAVLATHLKKWNPTTGNWTCFWTRARAGEEQGGNSIWRMQRSHHLQATLLQ